MDDLTTSAPASSAVFLDKDGTIVQDVPYNVRPELLRLTPDAGEALALLDRAGYRLFVVTNQSGVARGMFEERDLLPVRERLAGLLAPYGVGIEDWYICPHAVDGTVARYAHACTCRKPLPGLLIEAAREHALDLRRSWMVGDILDDVEAGRAAGCRTVLVDTGGANDASPPPARRPDVHAATLLDAANAILAIDRSARAHPVGRTG